MPSGASGTAGKGQADDALGGVGGGSGSKAAPSAKSASSRRRVARAAAVLAPYYVVRQGPDPELVGVHHGLWNEILFVFPGGIASEFRDFNRVDSEEEAVAYDFRRKPRGSECEVFNHPLR